MFPSIDPATVGFDVPLFVLMDHAMKAGFKAIEFSIRSIEEEITRKGKDKFLHLLRGYSIRIEQFTCGTGIPGNLSISDQRFEKALIEWGRYCDIAKELGIPRASLLVNSNKGDSYESTGTKLSKELLIRRLERILVAAKKSEIQISLEICDPSLLEDSKYIWEKTASHNLKLLIDTFTLTKLKNPIEFFNDIPRDAIGWIHIADELNGSRVLPGDGKINLHQILTVCRQKGYKGGLSLEVYENPVLDRLSLASKMQAVKKSFIESNLKSFLNETS